jgi:glutathione S-transferase
MSVYKIYGDKISGNCLKTKWVADLAALDYEWVDIDILKGESRTPEFLAKSDAGQVPVLELPDGRALAQSNAIITYLAEQYAPSLIPAEPFLRARMNEWLFWEQYNHETAIAVRRFHKFYLKKSDDDIDPALLIKGYAALQRLEDALQGTDFLVGEAISLADISLVAYTRMAGDGGFDLASYPAVVAWIARVEAALNLSSYTQEAA